jgi:hypothetical protein
LILDVFETKTRLHVVRYVPKPHPETMGDR